MKNFLIHLLIFLVVIAIGCKKEHIIVSPEDEGPFKIISRLPLPDSNIPYEALGNGKILFERNYGQSGSDFYIIDVDQRKTKGFTLKSSITQPKLSPSGNKIVCSLLNSKDLKSAWNIYVMNLDGSNCFPVSKSELNANYPTWNCDGSKIIYYTSGPEGRLYVQSATENSSDMTELTKFHYDDDPAWEIKPSGGFSISKSGKLVSVSSSEKASGIIGIEPYKGKSGVSVLLSPTTDIAFVSPNFRAESPVFSPDGSKVAFISIYTNPQESGWISLGIHTMDTNGTYLMSYFGMGGYPPYLTLPRYLSLCWSPDGTKILFNCPDSEISSHLFVINLDGSGWSQVTNQINAFDTEMSWSK